MIRLIHIWLNYFVSILSYFFLLRLATRTRRIILGKEAEAFKWWTLKNFLFDGGKFTDKISHSLSKRQKKKYSVKSSQLSTINEADALQNLITYGYYVVPEYLTRQQCTSVLNYALNNASYPRPTDTELASKSVLSARKLQQPYFSARYDFSPDLNLLFGCDVLQDLVSDKNLHQIAEIYLGLPGLLDPVELWWLVPYGLRDPAWAENYHFDHDSLKWLKFFFNFEEITFENGPHCYIEQTHKPGGIHPNILKKGYARLSDEEVLSAYDEKAQRIFTVPAGSLLIEDTRGLHKGLTPESGRRLMFQFQLSNVLFLTDEILNRRIKPNFPMTKNFENLYVSNPSFFSRYFK